MERWGWRAHSQFADVLRGAAAADDAPGLPTLLPRQLHFLVPVADAAQRVPGAKDRPVLAPEASPCR